MRAVIFDIDGTLADVEHRRQFLPHWGKFFAAQHLDTPIEAVAWLARTLWSNTGAEPAVIIVSARPADYEDVTREWLRKHEIFFDKLYMRPTGDYRKDSIVKREILQEILDDGYEPFLVIDDRPEVVDMWREYGLVCLQCAPEEIKMENDGKHFLDIMVGPSGAGKSTYIRANYAAHSVIETDAIRAQLFGSKEAREAFTPEGLALTFRYAHGLLRTRLDCHLLTVFDATNLKQKDRMSLLRHVPKGQYVRYIVIDRPYDVKMADRDWRPEDLVHKNHKLFHAELKNILAGDNLPNVVVIDKRNKK
jgi:predicted kinase